jgi:AraC-like DNA-binding protein
MINSTKPLIGRQIRADDHEQRPAVGAPAPSCASLREVGLSSRVVSGPAGPLVRVWAAECDRPTDFSSIAAVHPGIGFARIGGRTTVHLRGPATRASTLSCPQDSEYFGVDFRLGAYLPMFPPARLANLQDAVLPTLPNGRIVLDGDAWEMPTPMNVDVFVGRLERAGLLVVDPLIEDLRHGDVRTMPERTAQSRFVRAVGLSRRKVQVIERARRAAGRLRAGATIADVVFEAGYHDQPHLTRALRALLGYTPGEVARGDMFLDL